MQASAADGTEYALQIPADALLQDVAITVTPLTGLDGLPDGVGLAFGVSLEPEGLLFAEPAWLFVRSDDAPEDVASGLVMHAGAATPQPIAHDGERFIVAVTHFSGAGGASCMPRCGPGGFGWPDLGPGDIGRGPIQPPPGIPGFESPGTPREHGSSRTRSAAEGFVPPTEASSSSSTEADISQELDRLGKSQMEGDEEGEARSRDRLRDLQREAVAKAWDAAEACVAEKDLTKLAELVKWMGTAMVLEKHDRIDEDAEAEQLNELFFACNRFELQSIGTAEFRLGGDVIVMGDEINATTPLVYDGGAYSGSVTAPVPNHGFERGGEFLELLAYGLGGAMGVNVPNDIRRNDYLVCTTTPAQGTINAVAANLFGDTGPDLNLQIAGAGDATVTCPDPINTFPMPPMAVDMPLHQEAGFPGASESGIRVQDGWSRGAVGSNPVATRDIHHEIDSEGLKMILGWHLTINHAPGKLPPRPRDLRANPERYTPTTRELPSLTDP